MFPDSLARMQKNPMQTLRTLWAALMGSVVLLGVVCFVQSSQAHDNAPQQVMLVGIGVSAVFEAVLSFLLPAKTLKTAFRNFEAETVEQPASADESAMFGGEPRMEKVFKHPGKAYKAALARYQAPFILSLALSEAVALNGVVLSSLGFGSPVFLSFVAAGLVLMAIRYPNEERIIALIEKGAGARFPVRGALREAGS